MSRKAGDSSGSLAFKFAQRCQGSLSPSELSHPTEIEPFPLANIDAERVLDVLVASVEELHDDRMLGVCPWEDHASPPDADPDARWGVLPILSYISDSPGRGSIEGIHPVGPSWNLPQRPARSPNGFAGFEETLQGLEVRVDSLPHGRGRQRP